MTQKDIESVVEEVQSATVSDEYRPGNERWEMRPLSELMEPVLGKTPKRSEDKYWGGDIQWASAKDISQSETRHIYHTAENMTESGREASNAKILPAGTVVVIARGATMGRVAQLAEPMAFNQTCYALDANEQLLDDYLYYAWQYVFGQVQAVSYGTVFDSITMKSFKDIEIPLPPKAVQRHIANHLAKFDDLIESRHMIASHLRDIAKEEFNRRFVEYEPYTDFKKTEEGKIPENFQLKEFGKISQNHDSKREPLSQAEREERPGEIPYYGATGPLSWIDDYKFDGKYLLIAEDGSVKTDKGRPVLQFLNKKFWPSNHVHVVQGKDGVTTEFLRWALTDIPIEPYITGSVQPKVNQGNLNSIVIPVPPESDIQEFTQFVSKIHQLIWTDENMIETASEARDVLLPKLISGQIQLI